MLIAENREVAGVRPPRFGLDKAKTAVDAHAKSFDLARRAGVRIAAGTDYLHGSLHLELALMVRYGMPPANAPRSATFEAARLLRLEDRIGTVAPGRLADLIVIQGNPIQDIGALQRVRLVMQGGRVVVRTADSPQPATAGLSRPSPSTPPASRRAARGRVVGPQASDRSGSPAGRSRAHARGGGIRADAAAGRSATTSDPTRAGHVHPQRRVGRDPPVGGRGAPDLRGDLGLPPHPDYHPPRDDDGPRCADRDSTGVAPVRSPHAAARERDDHSRELGKLEDNRGLYCTLCYEYGGIIEDGVLIRFSPEKLWWVGGEAPTERWIYSKALGKRVEVRSHFESRHVASIQGPHSREILQRVCEADLSQVPHYGVVPETKVCGVSVVLSRTGFTGELGFDIYVSTDDGERLFRGLWETGRDLGMKAIGLAMVSADASEQGERLTVERGDRKSDVELVALPFVDPERKLPKV